MGFSDEYKEYLRQAVYDSYNAARGNALKYSEIAKRIELKPTGRLSLFLSEKNKDVNGLLGTQYLESLRDYYASNVWRYGMQTIKTEEEWILSHDFIDKEIDSRVQECRMEMKRRFAEEYLEREVYVEPRDADSLEQKQLSAKHVCQACKTIVVGPPDARRCFSCGAWFVRHCPYCQKDSPIPAQRCMFCGSALQGPAGHVNTI